MANERTTDPVNRAALAPRRRHRALRCAAIVLLAAPLAWLALGCEPPPPQAPPPPAAPPAPPADADGDGIPDDGTDKCLIEKEDGLPPDPTDGCKSTDPDGDGIVGDADRCPNEKEDGLPPDPKDGCKSPDPDGDGILGDADKCPGEPETKNGFEDEDGCPDKAPRVLVTATEVKINEKILFAFGKATIEPASQGLLDEIAFVIDDHPQIEHLEVAGHADKVGTDALNAQLTKQRAQAVLEALGKRGVDRRRMHAQGYGSHCQVDPGEGEAAREKNRRVEFKIMRIDGVETGVALGCEEASKHGIKPVSVPKTAPRRADLEKAKLSHPHAPPEPPAPDGAKVVGKPAAKPAVVKPGAKVSPKKR
jgi:outer membrane protein OmpA-like peptidoglycan-associated protein